MMHVRSPIQLLWLVLLVGACSFGEDDVTDVVSGVSWELARQRSRTISDLSYDLSLTVPEQLFEPIRGSETISFRLTEPATPLVLDFNQPADHVLSVLVNGSQSQYRTRNGHLVIPRRRLVDGENRVTLNFLAGDESLNRREDFLYTLFVPDRASEAFPCFDQPDLKARFRLFLDIPDQWEAVTNARILKAFTNAGRRLIQYDETKPISTYLFAFAVGRFEVEQGSSSNGRNMTLFHRETDRQKVERNLEDIFELHGQALTWLEEYTGIPYPFGDEQFRSVLIPAFQYGGMEHPGAIFYRDSRLFLDESPTRNDILGRASLIAHETAHMWFGDLVTMNWFDDVWMKEVFANFMAARIVNPVFPEVDHQLRFFLNHYPGAYAVDRSAGANPIRQPLENLKEAGSLYGAIIYQKAPIVMRQLELLIGEEGMRRGLRRYLERFSYGNAGWPDLIEILDRETDLDLRSWSRVWVEEPGRPTIRTELELKQGDTVTSLRLRQLDTSGGDRVWPQSLSVLLGGERPSMLSTLMEGTLSDLPEATGFSPLNFVLPAANGVGYARLQLDPRSRDYLLVNFSELSRSVSRSVALAALWDALLEGELKPGPLMDSVRTALRRETVELNQEQMVEMLTRLFWNFLSPEERLSLDSEVEGLLWGLMEETRQPTLKSTLFRAFRAVALSRSGVERLHQVWTGARGVEGLTLSEADMMKLALELAVRELPESTRILQQQRDRIRNPDRKEEFQFVMPALSDDSDVRRDFFAGLAEAGNRKHEPWVLEALSYLHHPLRAEASEPYLLPSLELLEEIQRTGDIFFPKGWLDVTLSGHSSKDAADVVRQFLADRPDYPKRLREKILQSADLLFRKARYFSTRETRDK